MAFGNVYNNGNIINYLSDIEKKISSCIRIDIQNNSLKRISEYIDIFKVVEIYLEEPKISKPKIVDSEGVTHIDVNVSIPFRNVRDLFYYRASESVYVNLPKQFVINNKSVSGTIRLKNVSLEEKTRSNKLISDVTSSLINENSKNINQVIRKWNENLESRIQQIIAYEEKLNNDISNF